MGCCGVEGVEAAGAALEAVKAGATGAVAEGGALKAAEAGATEAAAAAAAGGTLTLGGMVVSAVRMSGQQWVNSEKCPRRGTIVQYVLARPMSGASAGASRVPRSESWCEK